MKRLTQSLLLASALLVIAPADSAASARNGRAADGLIIATTNENDLSFIAFFSAK